MIKIFKNNDIKTVTLGAYESFFKPLGYSVIIESKPEKVVSEKPITKNEKLEQKEVVPNKSIDNKKLKDNKVNDLQNK